MHIYFSVIPSTCKYLALDGLKKCRKPLRRAADSPASRREYIYVTSVAGCLALMGPSTSCGALQPASGEFWSLNCGSEGSSAEPAEHPAALPAARGGQCPLPPLPVRTAAPLLRSSRELGMRTVLELLYLDTP